MSHTSLANHVVFKHFRDFLGFSQMELAVKMGSTQTTVARWESGSTPIPTQVMYHIRVLVERKLYDDMRRALSALVPQLTLADFEGIFAVPNPVITTDNRGRAFLGLIELMGHREHAFYISVPDSQLYAIDRNGEATLVDKEFVGSLRLHGTLESFVETKDDPLFQRARIRRIAEGLCHDATVIFDDAQPINWIRFRLDYRATGAILGTPSGYYHVSEIADMTDEMIRDLVCSLNPYVTR